MQLKRYEKYVGRNPAQNEVVTYRTVADSAAIEEAMAKGTVDVAWRGLSGAAITRFSRQTATNPSDLTDDGYTLQVLTGTRIRMLQWSGRPSLDSTALRARRSRSRCRAIARWIRSCRAA